MTGELEGVDELYIGKPKDGLVHDLLSTYSISSITIDRSEKEWMKSTSLKQFPTVTEPDHSIDYNRASEYTTDANPTVTDNVFTLDNIKFKDNRFIQGLISDVKSMTY